VPKVTNFSGTHCSVKYMYLIYSTEVSLIFNIIPKHINDFVPSPVELQNFLRDRNRALALATTLEQPYLLLLLHCEICSLPITVTATPTAGWKGYEELPVKGLQ
jgi:hypothetical protein